jgi:hypothetical protein
MVRSGLLTEAGAVPDNRTDPRSPTMIKYLLAAAALVVAGVPAAIGAVGNASFTQDVPVRVPEHASVPASGPTSPAVPGTDDDGTDHRGGGGAGEVGDDHGTDHPRHAEPGDDEGMHQGAEPGDDRGGRTAGSDDGAGHESGHESGHDSSHESAQISGGTSGSGGGSGSGSSRGGSDGPGSGSDGGHHGSDG